MKGNLPLIQFNWTQLEEEEEKLVFTLKLCTKTHHKHARACVCVCARCVPLAKAVGTCEARSKRTPKLRQHPPENCPITALLVCLPGWTGGERTSAHLEAPHSRVSFRLLPWLASARRGEERRCSGEERRGAVTSQNSDGERTRGEWRRSASA